MVASTQEKRGSPLAQSRDGRGTVHCVRASSSVGSVQRRRCEVGRARRPCSPPAQPVGRPARGFGFEPLLGVAALIVESKLLHHKQGRRAVVFPDVLVSKTRVSEIWQRARRDRAFHFGPTGLCV